MTPLKSANNTDEGEGAMYVDKAEIIAVLRDRGAHTRADWVDRQLPPIVDTYDNGALLQMLEIDLSTLAPVDPQRN